MKFKSEEEEGESICEETVKKPADHLMTSRHPCVEQDDDSMSISECQTLREDKSDPEAERALLGTSDGHSVDMNEKNSGKNWRIEVSEFALKSINPIRQTVESLKVQPNPHKSFIPLSIGDPNFFGNLLPHSIIANELKRVMDENKSWGYYASSGIESAREAIARYVSVAGAPVTASDIYVTSGGSHALDLCISLLAKSTGNILIPRPQLLAIADDHCLPIIAHEIYEGMVFHSINTPFVPIASLTTQVPVLSCRGLTKR